MKAATKFVVIAANLLTLVTGVSPSLHADTIPGVFSTGVDNFGTPLPVGTTDTHYTIAASPAGPVAAIVTSFPPAWIGDTLSSAWINASGSGFDTAAVGTFEYVLTFSLSGYNPASAVISGQWASDNGSSIFLNGVNTGFSNLSGPPYSYEGFTAFQLNSGFVAGVNELRFVVNNNPAPPEQSNPTALQVNILSATAVVPEPSTIALLCFCGLTLAGLRRTRASNL